jgi:hypothetical protein
MRWLLLAVLAVGAPGSVSAQDASLRRSASFTTVVIHHLNRTIGSESLPAASGRAVQSGMFVTLGLEQMFVFDEPVAALQDGELGDATVAQACKSRCPAVFYDAFQSAWLQLAVEGSVLSTQIPEHVAFAVDARIPARTLLHAAYASAETRPGTPPSLALLVNNPGRGLLAQAFYLVPPRGLELRQGGALLGLTIEIRPDGIRMFAADPELSNPRDLRAIQQLQPLLARLAVRHPGTQAAILVPKPGTTVGTLVQVMAMVRAEFPEIVLSAGQPIRL